MFTKPLNEITFEDIETFCNEWTEGVRVEYKKEIDVKKHIPKTVSAFANTLGGYFLIGVECDKVKNEVTATAGIPSKNGISESIIQCTTMNIYPPVIPTVEIIDIPNSNNVIVVVRVDESIQAPHTINNTTKVYIRTGDISQPEELAEIDRIEYMFKRREQPQVAVQNILNQIENNSEVLIQRYEIKPPTLTLLAQPTFPYRPIISPSTIYELHERQNYPPKRVDGGVCYFRERDYFSFHEFGIVYRKKFFLFPNVEEINYKIFPKSNDVKDINFGEILDDIDYFITETRKLYQKCNYQGDIDVRIGLRDAKGYKITHLTPDGRLIAGYTVSDFNCWSDLDVTTAIRCLSDDLEKQDKRKDIAEELICKILWIFDVPIDKQRIRDLVRQRIHSFVK